MPCAPCHAGAPACMEPQHARSPTDRSRAINAAIAASPITSSVVHMTRARAVCHAHDNERGTVPHPLCHPNPSQAAPLLSSCRHSSSSKRTSALISVAGTRYPFSTALTDNPRLTRRRADLAPSPVTTAWHGTEVPPPSGVSQLLSLAGAPCMLGLHACWGPSMAWCAWHGAHGMVRSQPGVARQMMSSRVRMCRGLRPAPCRRWLVCATLKATRRHSEGRVRPRRSL